MNKTLESIKATLAEAESRQEKLARIQANLDELRKINSNQFAQDEISKASKIVMEQQFALADKVAMEKAILEGL